MRQARYSGETKAFFIALIASKTQIITCHFILNNTQDPLGDKSILGPTWAPSTSQTLNCIPTQFKHILSWSYHWIEIMQIWPHFYCWFFGPVQIWPAFTVDFWTLENHGFWNPKDLIFYEKHYPKNNLSNKPHSSGPHRPKCSISCMSNVVRVNCTIVAIVERKLQTSNRWDEWWQWKWILLNARYKKGLHVRTTNYETICCSYHRKLKANPNKLTMDFALTIIM